MRLLLDFFCCITEGVSMVIRCDSFSKLELHARRLHCAELAYYMRYHVLYCCSFMCHQVRFAGKFAPTEILAKFFQDIESS